VMDACERDEMAGQDYQNLIPREAWNGPETDRREKRVPTRCNYLALSRLLSRLAHEILSIDRPDDNLYVALDGSFCSEHRSG
jgi:hypothetical protein